MRADSCWTPGEWGELCYKGLGTVSPGAWPWPDLLVPPTTTARLSPALGEMALSHGQPVDTTTLQWPMAPQCRVPSCPAAPSCPDRSHLSSGPACQICDGTPVVPVGSLRVAEVRVASCTRTASFHRTCGRTGSRGCSGHEKGPAAHPPQQEVRFSSIFPKCHRSGTDDRTEAIQENGHFGLFFNHCLHGKAAASSILIFKSLFSVNYWVKETDIKRFHA